MPEKVLPISGTNTLPRHTLFPAGTKSRNRRWPTSGWPLLRSASALALSFAQTTTPHIFLPQGSARILELSTQCRPTLPDNLPGIRMPRPRVLQINGMYRHGFMQAPALHDVALQWLNQGQSPLAAQFDLALQGTAVT